MSAAGRPRELRSPGTALRFGTDGVRGVANRELTPEAILALGRAVVRVLGRATFVVGRDTRRSGPLLTAALTAGLMAEGADVVDLGVLPTPAVAAVAAERGGPAAVVSASHNPFADNGIKLFGPGGLKLEPAAEAAIEKVAAELAGALEGGGEAAPAGAAVGTVAVDPDAVARYQRRLLDALEGRRLDGLPVVLDCANGAAAVTAPAGFRAAGADVVAVLAAEPDGTNINAGCGSTDPRALQAEVTSRRAALGLAFDGDADRVIAVDGTGHVVDGDRLLALYALDLQARGSLAGDSVVVTVMTNLGFHQAMHRAGIHVRTTDVGDRHVLAALHQGGWSLGGEQSGHIVFRELATTGDGVLSGLLLADLVVRDGRPLAELAGGVLDQVPQVLRNVAVADRDGLAGAEAVWAEVAAIESELGAGGRVLLRPSGTENLIRVMVEATTPEEAAAAVDRLAATVAGALGAAGRSTADDPGMLRP